MLYHKKLLFLILVILFISCIKLTPKTEFRSGDMEDPNFESPLEDAEFVPYLNFSNSIIEDFVSRRYKDVYWKYGSNEFKVGTSEADYSENLNRFLLDLGGAISFKRNQWWFIIKQENGIDIVRSIKIVKHKNGLVYYTIFLKKGEPNKFLRIDFQVVSN